jgi:diguanylate cyclase (GGDEF)-like protein
MSETGKRGTKKGFEKNNTMNPEAPPGKSAPIGPLQTPGPGQEITLADILRGKEATAFLFKTRALGKKAIITIVDDLSNHEREALYPVKPLTLNLEDDLLEKIVELQAENNHLRNLVLVDSLTGLYNNRFFTVQLEKEMARTRRTGLPCSLLVMDLDNFKALNDNLGHVEGNRFLITVATSLQEIVRSNDTICRYGGDEFTVIMPATGLYEASRIADRLIKAVHEISEPMGFGVSLSAGVAEYTTRSSWDMTAFIEETDSALYEAKRQGKNRLAVKGKPGPAMGETGMVSGEEKEALFAIKDHLQQKGEENDG